jgi:hypothetical protein
MQPMQPMQPMQQQAFPALNTGATPAIYANSQLPPGQIYSSGVPGAPPTIAVETGPATMGQFGSPQIKPKKANITLRKGRGISFAPGSGASSGGQEDVQSGGSVVVTVSKMG